MSNLSYSESTYGEKRKRGRPRKTDIYLKNCKVYPLRSRSRDFQDIVIVNTSSQSDKNVQDKSSLTIPRGRGRPRKSVNNSINNVPISLPIIEPSNPVILNDVTDSTSSFSQSCSSQTSSGFCIQDPPPDFDLFKIMQYIKWYYRGESISNIIRLHREFFQSQFELKELHFKYWIFQLETSGCINYHHLDGVVQPTETDLDNISDVCDMKLVKTEGEADFSECRYFEPEEQNIKTEIVVEEAKVERELKILSIREYSRLVKNLQYLKWYFGGKKITSIIRLHKELYRSPPFPKESAIRRCILYFTHNGCLNPLHNNPPIDEDINNVPAQIIINNLDLFEEYDLKNNEDKVLFRIIQCLKWYYRGESLNEVLALHQIYFPDSSPDVNQIKLWILKFDSNGCIHPDHEQDLTGFDINDVPEQLFGSSAPF